MKSSIHGIMVIFICLCSIIRKYKLLKEKTGDDRTVWNLEKKKISVLIYFLYLSQISRGFKVLHKILGYFQSSMSQNKFQAFQGFQGAVGTLYHISKPYKNIWDHDSNPLPWASRKHVRLASPLGYYFGDVYVTRCNTDPTCIISSTSSTFCTTLHFENQTRHKQLRSTLWFYFLSVKFSTVGWGSWCSNDLRVQIWSHYDENIKCLPKLKLVEKWLPKIIPHINTP